MLPLGELLNIGDLIRILRIKKKIKGKQKIEAQLSVNKDTLSRIERTSKYDPDALERIALGLGTSPAELLQARDALRNIGKAGLMPSPSEVTKEEHREIYRKLQAILSPENRRSEKVLRAAIDAAYGEIEQKQ